MREKENDFLDFKTFLAIGLLILSWLAWDYYMRKKYPKSFQNKTAIEEESYKRAETTSQGLTPPLSQRAFDKTPREKILKFRGKNLNIDFSSLGFGIKSLELKSYYDREKNPIRFHSSGPGALFSSSVLGSATPIPFHITKKAKKSTKENIREKLGKKSEEENIFYGEFSSKKLKITKRIEVIEELFLLKVKTSLEFKKGFLPNKGGEFKNRGISLNFSHPLPPPDSSEGFFQKFFIYGKEKLKAFVHYSGNHSLRLSEEDIVEEDIKGGGKRRYSKLNSAALGGKYFGKAFINRSDILPSIYFEKGEGEREGEVLAQLDYSFSKQAASRVQNLEYEIFMGPKSLKGLQKLDAGLGKWLDFGFFSWMARPILLFLNQIFDLCGNWGFSIIILTFFIRFCLLPINLKSYKSMKIMQKLQPEINALKKSYKKDPKKMNQEIMSLMKKRKANPLAGCLPLFLQFPIVFALYRALGESIELYQSPFILWIGDLSLKDPYYVLPIASGLIFFVQQLITPMSLPKEQAVMIKIIPLIFSVFMLSLPSGLTLYIFVTSFFGLAQQVIFLKTGLFYFNKGGKNAESIWRKEGPGANSFK